MFTGIIQQCGTVIERRDAEHGMTLVIDPGSWLHSPREGDSIAVNGCCLTVHHRNNGDHRLQFDVIPETLRCTAIGRLQQGDRVHLEHAATPTTLLGGHLVQGHIDGVGEVISVDDEDAEYRLRLRVPPGLSQYIIAKGSIAINGVSLTIASVSGAADENDTFDVALIPATLKLTTLGELKRGDLVNIETDYIAKLVVNTAQQVNRR